MDTHHRTQDYPFARTIRTADYTTPRTTLEAFGKRASPDDFNVVQFSRSLLVEAVFWICAVLAFLYVFAPGGTP